MRMPVLDKSLVSKLADAAGMRSQRALTPLSSHDCYCRITPTWMALPKVSVDSAVMDWHCSFPGDCSYNGVCDPS
jgi:hypothetical protein